MFVFIPSYPSKLSPNICTSRPRYTIPHTSYVVHSYLDSVMDTESNKYWYCIYVSFVKLLILLNQFFLEEKWTSFFEHLWGKSFKIKWKMSILYFEDGEKRRYNFISIDILLSKLSNDVRSGYFSFGFIDICCSF